VVPSLRHAAKIRDGRRRFRRQGNRFNDHRQASSTPFRRDKQMSNTALALLDTVTERAIAVEG
jgi:hypothetical protein